MGREESLIKKDRLHLEGQREAEEKKTESFRENLFLPWEMWEGFWLVGKRVSALGANGVF